MYQFFHRRPMILQLDFHEEAHLRRFLPSAAAQRGGSRIVYREGASATKFHELLRTACRGWRWRRTMSHSLPFIFVYLVLTLLFWAVLRIELKLLAFSFLMCCACRMCARLPKTRTSCSPRFSNGFDMWDAILWGRFSIVQCLEALSIFMVRLPCVVLAYDTLRKEETKALCRRY